MSQELVVAIAVFFAVLGGALVIVSLASRRSVRFHSRLGKYFLVSAPGDQESVDRVEQLLNPFRTTSSFLARRLGRLRFVAPMGVDLVHANVRFGVLRYLLMRLVIAAVAFGVVQIVFDGLLFSAAAALVGFMIPRIVIKKKGSRRAAAFENRLAEMLDLLVGSLRAGQGLLQAIESASSVQPEPMRTEMLRVVGQVNMGTSISDAMESLTTRFDSRDVDLLAAAIAINRETGGNLTEVLERLAKTVRQRRDVRAEAKALTAAPRATSYFLLVIPFIITGYSVAISPIYRERLLHTQVGRTIVIGAIIWSFVGFFISQKLAKAEY
jgi:tight adherence protein B